MQNLYLFFIASLLLNLTPGNDMMYVASRSISQGTKAGIISAAGVFIGCFVHITAAVFGLSILIMKSAFLFELIKFLGAGYLIYLGAKTILTKSNFNENLQALPPTDKWKLLKQGVITNALNPKVALFFYRSCRSLFNPGRHYIKHNSSLWVYGSICRELVC